METGSAKLAPAELTGVPDIANHTPNQTGSEPPLPRSVSGRQLAAAYVAAARWLERHAAQLDALNVFPVPDGDTGRNMRDTFQAAVAGLGAHADEGAGAVAQHAADAALLGARGNSGVILSQVLGGVAAALRDHDVLDAPTLCLAFAEAARFAYRAVAVPVEGTMLTVVREVATAVTEAAQDGRDLCALFDVAERASKMSIERTPELLPILRQAGVVDAGAEGIGVILAGIHRFVNGQSLEAAIAPVAAGPALLAVQQAAHSLDEQGYCTNFVIRAHGGGIVIDQLRAAMLQLGSSAVVAGSERLAKVHVHTEHPGEALEAGGRWGELTAIEIMNMRDQVAEAHPTAIASAASDLAMEAEAPAVGLLAVTPSEAWAKLFRERFHAATVRGGQTMNPSVGELVEALRQASGGTIIVLPNNGNVILTASEAVRLAGRPAAVLSTTSLPQGLAAALASLASDDIASATEAMTAAAQAVVTIEVTTASRAAKLDGVSVEKGQPIALVDGTLRAVATSYGDVALQAVTLALLPEHALLCVYAGVEATDVELRQLDQDLRRAHPHLEIESLVTGQAFYPYVISLE